MCESDEYSDMGLGPLADDLERIAAFLEIVVPALDEMVENLVAMAAAEGTPSELQERELAQRLGVDRAKRALRRIARNATDPFDALLRDAPAQA